MKELAEELIPVSHNQFSIRRCKKILEAVKADGDTARDYQIEKNEITRGLVRDVKHYVAQLEEVDRAISDFLPQAAGIDFDFKMLNQHHLLYVEKQNRVPNARSAGKLRLKVNFL